MIIRHALLIILAQTGCGSYHEKGESNAETGLADMDTAAAEPCSLSGLVAWWPGQGSAEDLISTEDANPATKMSYAPGIVGSAFAFDDSSSGLTAAASESSESGVVQSLTFDAWVYPTDLSTERPIIEYSEESGPAGAHFWLNTLPGGGSTDTGTLYANLRDIDGDDHRIGTDPDVIDADTWTHVAVTYDGDSGVGVLYANGEVVSKASMGNFTPQTSEPVNLGRRPPMSADGSAGARFAGLLDEVDIWDRSLSEAEVRSIYEAGALGKCSGHD